jgi:hypothetical protein
VTGQEGKPMNGTTTIDAMMRTDTKILADAMDILARDIQSGDGVANAAIAEAAQRMREQAAEIERLREENEELHNLTVR